MPVGRATAQTFTILRSFGTLTNVTGTNPRSTLVQGADGTLYGTTSGGEGNVMGTVFKVRPDGSGFTVLKRITAPPGGNPWVGLTLSGNTLYGTTSDNGNLNGGTVFSINTDGTGYTVLYILTNSTDGAFPSGALMLSGSTLYGTTTEGGSSGNGTVFKLNTDGTGYTVLHNFAGASDGVYPQAGLRLSGSTLYGTTASGGNVGYGTVFSINTDGTGYTVLGNFPAPNGGPSGTLILSGNTLYGTTSLSGGRVLGTVFKVNTDGTGYTVLYNFTNSPDGANPEAELTLSDSTLYGTTYGGGSSNSGTVFKLNTDGTGYAVLYSFTGLSDGGGPAAGVLVTGSTLYGTANWGGSSGYGTVFKLNTDGTGYTVLQSFTHSTDGVGPTARLTPSGSTLYGTTRGGGSFYLGVGTVFKLNTDGRGYTVLYNFTGVNGGPGDGAYPNGGLALLGNTLYGTANGGGSSGFGTVFSINMDGTGYAVLNDFDVEGDPAAGLTLSGSTLYGTTAPLCCDGTVFKLNTDGTGFTVLRVLTNSIEGNDPTSELTLSGSTLYGTTLYGGASTSGNGTVFSINTDGSGYTVMHNFTDSPDGAGPSGKLALSGGTLYGVTASGGNGGYGTVFSINTDGTGYTVLKSLPAPARAAAWLVPVAGLTLWGSTLYGATPYGGSSGYGTLFKLNTDGTGYAVVKSFTGPPDGAYPLGGLILSGTTLYGTTGAGGDLDEGTVFSLNLAPLLNISTIPGAVVLNWDDPAFNLQSAPEAAGVYSSIPGAKSPYTNLITARRQFFRLTMP